MYNIIYSLVDGSTEWEELHKCSKEGIERLIYNITSMIQTDGVIQFEKRMPAGDLETIIINAKNIMKVECINLDDQVTEDD